jgi:hypothetical protein
MQTLSGIEVPAVSGLLKRAEGRWESYVDDPADAQAFAGQALTHTDWTPDNVLMSADRAWLVDWPTLGAPWTDPACWIPGLMAAGGHTAAEAQAARVPAYAAADPASIDLFACANVPLWDEIEEDGGGASWREKMGSPPRHGPPTASRASLPLLAKHSCRL